MHIINKYFKLFYVNIICNIIIEIHVYITEIWIIIFKYTCTNTEGNGENIFYESR